MWIIKVTYNIEDVGLSSTLYQTQLCIRVAVLSPRCGRDEDRAVKLVSQDCGAKNDDDCQLQTRS